MEIGGDKVISVVTGTEIRDEAVGGFVGKGMTEVDTVVIMSVAVRVSELVSVRDPVV